MSESGLPWTSCAGGVLLHVRLTPKGGRDAIEGIQLLSNGSAVLKVRVRVAPESGKANDALIALMAASLSIARSTISLQAGSKSRHKTLAITGNSASLAATLQRLAET